MPSGIDKLIRWVRRRLLLITAINKSGLWLSSALVFSLGLLAIDRLGLVSIPLWIILTICITSFIGSLIWVFIKLPGQVDIAKLLDQKYELKDRIGTALTLDSQEQYIGSSTEQSEIYVNPFSDSVFKDAERTALRINKFREFPVIFPNTWLFALALILAVYLSYEYVPHYDIFGNKQKIEQQQAYTQASLLAQNTVSDIENSIRVITQQPSDASGVADKAFNDSKIDEVLETLNRLNKQLTTPTQDKKTENELSSDELLTKTANELNQLADSLEDEYDTQDKILDKEMQQLANLNNNNDDNSNEDTNSELIKSLRNGNFDKAAEYLDSLAQHYDKLTPDQKKALSQQLSRMSEQLKDHNNDNENINNKKGENKPVNPTKPENPEIEKLKNLNIDEKQAQEIAESNFNKDKIQNALENKGLPREQAEDIAKQISDDAETRKAEQEANDNINRLSQQLKNLSEVIEDNESTSKQTEDNPGNNSDNTETAKNEKDQDTTPPDNNAQENTSTEKPLNDSLQQQQNQQQDVQQQAEEQNQQETTQQQKQDTQKNTGEPVKQQQQQQDQQTQQTVTKEQQQITEQQSTTKSENDKTNPDKQQNKSGKDNSDSNNSEKDTSQQTISKKPQTTQDPAGQNEITEDKSMMPDQENPGEQQGAKPGEQPEDKQSQPDEDSKSNPFMKNLDGLKEEIQNLATKKDNIDKQKTISKEMRNKAKQLLEQLSPEEKEQLQRWASEMKKETPDEESSPSSPPLSGDAPDGNQRLGGYDPLKINNKNALPDSNRDYTVEDVDASGNNLNRQSKNDLASDEKTLAEWYNDIPESYKENKQPTNISDGQASARKSNQSAIQQRLIKAARELEKSLNQNAILPRHQKLIKRWAERLPETLNKKETQTKTNDNPENTNTTTDKPDDSSK